MAVKSDVVTFDRTLDELYSDRGRAQQGLMFHEPYLDTRQKELVSGGGVRVHDPDASRKDFRDLMGSLGVSDDLNASLSEVVGQNSVASKLITPMIPGVEALAGKSKSEMSPSEFMEQMDQMLGVQVTTARDVKRMAGLGADFQARFDALGKFQQATVAHSIGAQLVERQANFSETVSAFKKAVESPEIENVSEGLKVASLANQRLRSRFDAQLEHLSSSSNSKLAESLQSVTGVVPGAKVSNGAASMDELQQLLSSSVGKTGIDAGPMSKSMESAMLLQKLLDEKTVLSPELEAKYAQFKSPEPLSSKDAEERVQTLGLMIQQLKSPEFEMTNDAKAQAVQVQRQLESMKETATKIKETQDVKEQHEREIDLSPKVQAIVTSNAQAPGCAELADAVAVLYAEPTSKGESMAKGELGSTSVSAAAPVASGHAGLDSSILAHAKDALATAEALGNDAAGVSVSSSKTV